MTYPIIDIHTHLGDVLYPGGGRIIEYGHVRKKLLFDVLDMLESRDWSDVRGARFLGPAIVKAGMERSKTATRANLRASMDRHGIDYCAVMAVPPIVSFDHLHAAYQHDPTMLPFTGVDFDNLNDVDAQFASDVARGARGLKLHPILQRTELNSPQTFNVVEAFAPHRLPVLFHSGYSEYYSDEDEKPLAIPDNGHIEPAVDIVKAFPNVNFIVGHAGLSGVDFVMDLLGGFDNVYLDISFQNAQVVTKLLDVFGPDRIMYASDWPWGNQDVSLRIVDQVCRGDIGLKRRLLCDNAANLLKLELPDVAERKPLQTPVASPAYAGQVLH